MLIAGLWPLEAVASWCLWRWCSGKRGQHLQDIEGQQGSSSCNVGFRAMLNPTKGELINSRILLNQGEHQAGGWAAQQGPKLPLPMQRAQLGIARRGASLWGGHKPNCPFPATVLHSGFVPSALRAWTPCPRDARAGAMPLMASIAETIPAAHARAVMPVVTGAGIRDGDRHLRSGQVPTPGALPPAHPQAQSRDQTLLPEEFGCCLKPSNPGKHIWSSKKRSCVPAVLPSGASICPSVPGITVEALRAT